MSNKQQQAVKKAQLNLEEQFEQELSQYSFGDLLQLAEDITDMSVSCTPTGFPQLDAILHHTLRGLPKGRDIEICSMEREVGQTSLGLQILQHWQELGKSTLIIDVERTITTQFLAQLGIVTSTNAPNIVPVRISRPSESDLVEEILDLVKKASQVFDLIVVDSIGAMDIKADLEKEYDEGAKIGAMALLLSNFLKKNVAKKAAVIWLNQARHVVGGYKPTGQIRYSRVGGSALPFFGTIRLELSVVEELKDAEGNVYAMNVKVCTTKNKVSPQFKSAILTYVMGQGFLKN